MKILRTQLTAVVFAILGIQGLGIAEAQATVITNGCANAGVACTLQELVGGGTIIVDDKIFGGWSVDDDSTLPVDISGIDVVGLDDQPLNPGLQFNADGQLSTVGLDLIDLMISFGVATLDGSTTIRDNSLEINQFTFGTANIGGFINIIEDVLDANGALLGGKFVQADNEFNAFDLFDSAVFVPQSAISVDKFILVGGTGQGDISSLDAFTQRFSQVSIPEPSIIALMGIAFVGFAVACVKNVRG